MSNCRKTKKRREVFFLKYTTFLFFSFIFLLLPSKGTCVTLSSADISKSFFMLQNETVDLHTSLSLGRHNFRPEEEAVIVFVKGATTRELINLNFKTLPREFLIKAVTKGGKIAIGVLVDPIGVVKDELLVLGKNKLINYLRQGQVKVGNGKIAVFYTDINRERQTVFFFYTILFCSKENDISITIYSENFITPPLSKPSYSVLSTKWRQNDFRGDKIRPFTVTFNGKVKESQFGGFSFATDPKMNVEFFSEEYVFEEEKTGESFFDKIGNFFTGISNLVAESWQALAGLAFFNNDQKTTTVDLSDLPSPKIDGNKEDTSEEKEPLQKEVIKEKPKEEEQGEEYQIPKRVEVNSALGEDLERLSGIGPTYAQRIIANRPFCNIEELTKVPGIGEVTLKNIVIQGIGYVNPPESCNEQISEKEIIPDIDRDALIEELEKIRRELERIRREREEKTEEETEEDEERDKEGVEINSATKEELQKLTGIGGTYAERIIKNRPFCNLDELTKVSGIGEATVKAIIEQGIGYVNPPESCLDDNGGDGSRGGGGSEEIEGGKDGNDGDSDDEEETVTKVEINTATQNHLEMITGVGPVTAQNIIANRPFCDIDELLNVSGIGPVTLSNIKNQGLAYVDPPESCPDDNGDDGDNNDNGDDNNNGNGEGEITVVGAETVKNKTKNFSTINAHSASRESMDTAITHKEESKTTLSLTPVTIGGGLSGSDGDNGNEGGFEEKIIITGAETTWVNQLLTQTINASSTVRETLLHATITRAENFMQKILLSVNF